VARNNFPESYGTVIFMVCTLQIATNPFPMEIVKEKLHLKYFSGLKTQTRDKRQKDKGLA
jgi:hypothetical protein